MPDEPVRQTLKRVPAAFKRTEVSFVLSGNSNGRPVDQQRLARAGAIGVEALDMPVQLVGGRLSTLPLRTSGQSL